jgi:hypothetical protein
MVKEGDDVPGAGLIGWNDGRVGNSINGGAAAGEQEGQ